MPCRSSTNASQLLRDDLLQGVTIALACAGSATAALPGDAIERAVRAGCSALGARVSELALIGDDGVALDEPALEAAVDRVLGEAGSVELLVVDAAGLFAAASGRAALVESLEASWNVTRALVNRAFLGAEPGSLPRRVVYVAPDPGAGEHAEAARAGLENLARTLSIEWSRHAITLVTIAPGRNTAADEVAALIAYLASPAGDYFSGCLLDLRGPAQSSES